MPITNQTRSTQYPSFNDSNGLKYSSYPDSCVEITFNCCPNCGQLTIKATGVGQHVKDINLKIRPRSSARQYPAYIPDAIRADYEEACSIVDLSPKASATLARRCLQGMIRDYWGISDKTLFLEISALKDRIQPDLWVSIDALRQLGNIGAHMEKDTNVIVDIDANEANSLIKLIELLIKEWYIAREDRKNLFENIQGINNTKQDARKNED